MNCHHCGATGTVLVFKCDFDEGKAVLSMELVRFLRKWLAGHILGLDKKFGPFFNEKGLT